MSWVNTVLLAAQRMGVAPERVMAAAGIASAELGHERWPIDHITRLWRAAAALTGDPGFGLKAGGLVGPAGLNVVSFMAQSASTLRESIDVVVKYQRLVSDGGRLQVIAGGDASWLIYHPRQGELPFSPHQIEAVLAAVVAIARWVTSAAVQPLKVQFSQPSLGPPEGYGAAFGCPVEFEQAFNGLLIDNALLDQPLPQADAQLARVHQQYAAARLAALAPADDLVPALRRWLAGRIHGQPPGRAEAAQAFGLSARTLARRLQERQLDFSTLVDEVRRDAALQAVAQGRHSLARISQSLGFAEPSTFWRAFRRWTGQTPAEWRREQAGVPETGE
ncbi:AraC family transcriptional regulator [Pseudomonas sp. GD03985]|uniref:AraC family transcriptional regulator n=1 Tax=Pseudomonas sp. GD03985 TaxID=2975414 RepID=UPI00244A0F58|nr:AraC family transcriptional regulator [Pseudomonas sp. GD03985]MDH1065566.1 AraC family transcriptional regulator [Pseudomonas sp. GD03985]